MVFYSVGGVKVGSTFSVNTLTQLTKWQMRRRVGKPRWTDLEVDVPDHSITTWYKTDISGQWTVCTCRRGELTYLLHGMQSHYSRMSTGTAQIWGYVQILLPLGSVCRRQS